MTEPAPAPAYIASLVVPMTPHPEVQQLAEALCALEAHLRANGAPDWADHIDRCATLIQQSDYYGVVRFFGLLGGMGSLSDLVLCREGQILTLENEKLEALLGRAYRIADALRRDEP